MKARQQSNGEYKLVAPGADRGVVYLLADLGLQPGGNFAPAYKLALGVQFPGQLTDNGEPLSIIGIYTSSMHKKAKLRAWVEGLFGKAFPNEDAAKAFDLKQLLGRAGFFNVTHTERGEKTFANIVSAMPVPNGIEKPVVKGEPIYYSSDLEPKEASQAYQRLPEWIRKKIDGQMQPVSNDGAAADAPAAAEDDIPF